MKETRSEEAFVDFPTKKKIQFTLHLTKFTR